MFKLPQLAVIFIKSIALRTDSCNVETNKKEISGSVIMVRSSIFAFFACLSLVGTSGIAESARLQGDFSFKRVKVPASGTTRRITVQIDPNAQRPVVAPTKDIVEDGAIANDAARANAGLEWFWFAVSPKLSDTGPGRLEQATRAIEKAPDGQRMSTPRLQALQSIASKHGLDILRATVGTDVSPALVLALISVESGGRTEATSSAGAQGVMQLMPATAARFGVTNSMNSAENIKGGVAYLAWLMKHFDNDPILVLAGYNAGEGSVRDNAGVPPFAETRAYVPKVLAAWGVAKGLCLTPPELITDGCVFHNNGA